MVDVRGDVLRPPHCTTPAAVNANKNQKMCSFKSIENIHKKQDVKLKMNKNNNITDEIAARLIDFFERYHL